MRARVHVALLVLATLVACGEQTTPHHPEVGMSDQPSDRRIVPVPQERLRALWTRGGEHDDSVLFMPVSITADSDLVFVTDVASHEVIAFRADDGSVAWRIGGRGAGPSEFDVPMGLAVLPSRELAVIDQRNARIAIVSRAGAVVQHVSLASLALTTSVCGAADGSLLVAAAGDRAAEIVRVGRDGRIVGRLGLPWAEARTSSAIATQLRLERRGFDGSCFVGLMLGVGFALFDGDRFTHVRPYVERLALPVAERSGRGERLAERQIAIADVSIDDGEIAVAFEGRTSQRRRLLDMYDAATGAYRRTYLIDPTVTSMARDGGRFFFLIERRGYLSLEAVEMPAAASATR